MNSINLIGRVGKDPEIRTTQSGKTVATFSVAVTRDRKDADGNKVSDWFRVIAWEKTADFVANYISKGRLVSVSGRMECRKWIDNEGHNHDSWEVQASAVSGLDRPTEDPKEPATKQTRGTSTPKASNDPTSDEYDPFADS